MFKPQGGFERINSTYENGTYSIDITDRKFYQYDKIKLIGICSGAFTITDVRCEYSGGVDKEYKVKQIEMKHQGEELILQRGFDSDWNSNGGWSDGGNVRVQMPSDVRSYPPYLSTNSHVTLGKDADGFPQLISRNININTSQSVAYKELVVRVVARLFPLIYNPDRQGEYYTNTPQITPETFDYSNLCIEFDSNQTSAMIPMVTKHIVDIGWSQIEARIPIPPLVNSFKISLYRDTEELIGHASDNFEMQIADVSCQVM